MSDGAFVGSIDAIRDFRAAVCAFIFEAREAVGAYEAELRRTLDWMLEDRPRYWQHAARRAEDAVVEARIELERRRNERLPGGEPPSCMVERRALERARQRRQFVEEKIDAVHKWGIIAGREATEYRGQANQLQQHLDADLPRAIAMLDRALAALESYAALQLDRGQSRADGFSLSKTFPPPAVDGPGNAIPAADVPPVGHAADPDDMNGPTRFAEI